MENIKAAAGEGEPNKSNGAAIETNDAVIKALRTELSDLAASLKEKDERIAGMEQQLKTVTDDYLLVTEINKELTLQVEALSNTTPATKPDAVRANTSGFSRNGKNYGFNFTRAVLKGGRKITNTEVVADEALQDELIAANSTMIREEE